MSKVFVENLSNRYKVGELPDNTFFFWNDKLFMTISSSDYADDEDYRAVWNFNDNEDGAIERNTEVLWIRYEDIEIRVLKGVDNPHKICYNKIKSEVQKMAVVDFNQINFTTSFEDLDVGTYFNFEGELFVKIQDAKEIDVYGCNGDVVNAFGFARDETTFF